MTIKYPPMPEFGGEDHNQEGSADMVLVPVETIGWVRHALRAPLDGWKGELERKALDLLRDVTAAPQPPAEPQGERVLQESKANFERQFGKSPVADWIYDDLRATLDSEEA